MKGGTLTRVWMQFAVSFWSLGKFLIPPPAPAFLHPIVSVWFSLVLLYINKSLCFPHIVHFMIWLKAIKNDGNLEKELLNSTNPSILVMERLNFSKWQLFFFSRLKFCPVGRRHVGTCLELLASHQPVRSAEIWLDSGHAEVPVKC